MVIYHGTIRKNHQKSKQIQELTRVIHLCKWPFLGLYYMGVTNYLLHGLILQVTPPPPQKKKKNYLLLLSLFKETSVK